MSALIAGIDFSSKAIHAALIQLDPSDGSDAPPVTLRSFEMPTWKRETTPAFRTVERCRVVRDAMRELLEGVETVAVEAESVLFSFHDVVHVCVETPLGSKSRSTVLWELYGAILASIPSHIERDTITCQEWRRIIWPNHADHFPTYGNPKDWKGQAITEAMLGTGLLAMDEHQAESYLIARACRSRLEAAVKGAA
jgi:hypothetical protein